MSDASSKLENEIHDLTWWDSQTEGRVSQRCWMQYPEVSVLEVQDEDGKKHQTDLLYPV